MSSGIIGLLVFLLTVISGVPISFALGFGSIIALLMSNIPLIIITQRVFSQTNSFLLLSIPFFMMAGEIMNKSGITERLINLANLIMGRLKGGMAYVTILVSMIFAGITGLAQADAAAIGSIMIPSMEKNGYDKKFTAAVTAGASSVGPIIPPSVPAIIYASITGVSVGSIFLAGAIPGILMGLGFMFVVYISVKTNKYMFPDVVRSRLTMRTLLIGLRDASLALIAPIIILGGIAGGWFTATESAAMTVVYSLIVGFVFYKSVKMSDLPEMVRSTAIGTGMVVIVMGLANSLGWVIANAQLPIALAGIITETVTNPIIFMLIVIAILLVVGCVLNTSSAIIIFAPILVPIASSLGIDQIQFGELVVATLVVGLLTPPVGLVLYIISGIAKCSIEDLTIHLLPYLGVCIIVLILMAFIPALTLYLPSLLIN